MPQRAEPDHILGMPGQEQILHHVEDEERAHSIIGEALPHLGREQECQPARMAEKVSLSSGRATTRAGSRKAHDGISAAVAGLTRGGDVFRLAAPAVAGGADPRTRGGLPSNRPRTSGPAAAAPVPKASQHGYT